MSTRWWTLLVWTAVAASALYWGLKLFVTAPAVPARTAVAVASPVLHADLKRLLGVDPPPPVVAVQAEPAPDARFQLLGVLSPKSGQAAREGVALIAVDGKPAKAYRVGAVVDGQTVLKSVASRGAMLGPQDGPAVVALNIAPPPAPATGVLPDASPRPALAAQAPPINYPAPAAPTALPNGPGQADQPARRRSGESRPTSPGMRQGQNVESGPGLLK